MKVFSTVREWKEYKSKSLSGSTLGFVPTMGALHEGHLSLVNRSLIENENTLVSIFVNPTQFNDPKDLECYPRPFKRDLDLLSESGASFVFAPSAQEMYPGGFRYRVEENEVSLQLEGEHRPGHFSGMLTVVLKLLNIAQADNAYFGEKDFQQLLLIQGLAEAFFLQTKIIACPTLRETSGLAMSSRNLLLSAEERNSAALLYDSLLNSPTESAARQSLENKGFRVDYWKEQWGRRLVAARLGSVRLIDNISLTKGEKIL